MLDTVGASAESYLLTEGDLGRRAERVRHSNGWAPSHVTLAQGVASSILASQSERTKRIE
jgi:hypothetical protein